MKVTDLSARYSRQILSEPYSPSTVKEDNGKNSLTAVEKLMEELKDSYKHINFDFTEIQSTGQIKDYAASQKGFYNVSVSPALLEKMAADKTVRAKVEQVLSSLESYRQESQIQALLNHKKLNSMGLILDENGEVSKWTASEEAEKKEGFFSDTSNFYGQSYFEPVKTDKKSYTSMPYKYSQSSNMMRLANAKNVAAVRGLLAAKQSEIGKVKMQVTDPAEAAAIIRKIKAVIRSGNIKIARLHKEERLQQLKRSAAKREKSKLERQLAEELRRKRIARKAQEYCQTASFDDIFVKPSVHDEKYRQISEQYANVAADIAAVPAVSSAIPAQPVEISVAPVITVDCNI